LREGEGGRRGREARERGGREREEKEAQRFSLHAAAYTGLYSWA